MSATPSGAPFWIELFATMKRATPAGTVTPGFAATA
jgi:hypothetical protein